MEFDIKYRRELCLIFVYLFVFDNLYMYIYIYLVMHYSLVSPAHNFLYIGEFKKRGYESRCIKV